MRKSSALFLLLFLQACAGTSRETGDTLLFPFEKIQNGTYEENSHDLLLSEKGTQTFVYLGLYQAIKRDDYEKILLYAETLSQNNPEPLYLAEAITWLYNKGYVNDAKKLLEQSLPLLPDELPFILMYAELLQNMQGKEDVDVSIALDLLNNYIQKHPKDYNAYIELGVMYYKLYQYENAYMTFLRIPEKERLSSVFLYMGICLEKMERYGEAKQYFNKVLKEFPEEKTALHHLGEIAEAQGNFALAAKYYSKILELDDTNYDYLLKLISLAFKEGNHQKAFDIAKEHFNFDFIVAASSMLIQEGRVDLAEELLNNLSAMEDAPRELLYLHGALIYEAGKDKNRALGYLLQLTEEDEHYKNAQEIIAHIYLEQNDFDAAMPYIKNLQQIDPEEKKYYVLEYQTYLFRRQYEQAYEALYAYVKKYPDDIHAKFRFAYTCFHLGEKDKALSLMKEILEAEPDNYEALNFVGYTLVEQKRDLKLAEEYLLKADSLCPDQDYINDSLAWLYYTKGEYEKAFLYIEKAISLVKSSAPEDASMWEHYGDIAVKAGKPDIAKYAYEKVLTLEDRDSVKEKLKGLQE